MRYVPEELYLTWKERAEVSRKYAAELLKSHEEMSQRLSHLQLKAWAQENEIQHLKRTPHNKLQTRLLKTQQRLFWAKENARKEIESLKTQLSEVKALTEAYLDVLKDKY